MLCRVTRFQLSTALDGDGSLAWPGRSHVGRCAECRALGERMDALHGRLARGAAHAVPPAPARARRPVVALAVGAVALGAAAAVALFVARSDDRPSRPGADRAASMVDQRAYRAAARDLPSGPSSPPSALVERASDLLAAPPLRDELAALVTDGRRGTVDVLERSGLGGLARAVE